MHNAKLAQVEYNLHPQCDIPNTIYLRCLYRIKSFLDQPDEC